VVDVRSECMTPLRQVFNCCLCHFVTAYNVTMSAVVDISARKAPTLCICAFILEVFILSSPMRSFPLKFFSFLIMSYPRTLRNLRTEFGLGGASNTFTPTPPTHGLDGCDSVVQREVADTPVIVYIGDTVRSNQAPNSQQDLRHALAHLEEQSVELGELEAVVKECDELRRKLQGALKELREMRHMKGQVKTLLQKANRRGRLGPGVAERLCELGFS
jgi:hypothetical protein